MSPAPAQASLDRPPPPIPDSRSEGALRAAVQECRACERAGISSGDVYITNVVKHFRYKLRGKRRIHQKPDRWRAPDDEQRKAAMNEFVSDLKTVARWLSGSAKS